MKQNGCMRWDGVKDVYWAGVMGVYESCMGEG